MTLIWILLAAKAVFCAVAAAPTLIFMRGGGWLKRRYRGHVAQGLERTLRRLSPDFRTERDFFASGVGLAADFSQGRFFIAERDGGRTQAAVLPFAALQRVARGEMNQNGFYDIYVELQVNDPARPRWRLLLGENEQLACAVNATLGRLQANCRPTEPTQAEPVRHGSGAVPAAPAPAMLERYTAKTCGGASGVSARSQALRAPASDGSSSAG